MAPSLDAVWIGPVDDLTSWVEEREALLIAAEDEMFRAARNRATTDEERAYWEDLLALRAKNCAAWRAGR